MGKKNSNSMKNLSEVMMHTPETELIVNAEILGFNQYGEMEGMKTLRMEPYLPASCLTLSKVTTMLKKVKSFTQ